MAAKKKGKRGRPPVEKPKTMYVQIRTGPDWHAWLKTFAKREGDDMASLVESATKMYARLRQFEPPPER